MSSQPARKPSEPGRPPAKPECAPPEPVEERCPTEAELDKAIADSFPASDPISLQLEATPPNTPGRDAPCPD